MAQQAMTITQVNEYIRSLIDSDQLLVGLAVCGEISNYKVYPSGHHYFTLKDEGASLKCVLFRSNAVRLKFKPADGMKVIVLGRISVYPRDGVYQLYCTNMIIDGMGDLHTAFEKLKEKLSAEGLFDPKHKKEIPAYPERIGIITSSAGAALHDMLRIISARFPLAKTILLPVRVQGVEAPPEISAAITYANAYNLADVLIVGRGGGSIEDLWAFNDERVARAIYASEIPVISAVGHEPDVTISDYVADLRAATPSNAAELVVPDRASLLQTLDKQQQILSNAIHQKLSAAKKHLQILSSYPGMTSPYQYIERKRSALSHLSDKLAAAQQQRLNQNKQRFIRLATKLDSMNPVNVLLRGYSVTRNPAGDIVHSVRQISSNDKIRITFADGSVNAIVDETVEDLQ